MAVDSGTYTPETLARRMKIAEALMGEPKQPIRHWAEGLNELAKGYFGGKLYSGVERAERESNAAQSEALKSLLGGGSSEPTGSIPNAGASPMGSLPSMSSRVYSENEFNPIDAMVATPEELAAGVPAPKQYAALIGKAAVDNDLPPELLAAQIKQESGFNPNAVSPAGATGISQFMPGTAKEMGVNPLDPASAIPGGARYLRQNIDKFGGSVPLGLAAYNAGPGRVQQSGGDISKLPAETRGYIANILGSQGGAGGTQVAQAGGDTRARVIQMLNDKNPAVQKMGRSLATGLVGKMLTPADYDIQQRPDGTVIAVNKKNPSDMQVINAPGAGKSAIQFEADKAAAVAKAKGEAEKQVGKEDREKEQKQVANIVTQDIDRAISLIDTSSLPTTGIGGQLLSNVGGTSARDVGALIDTVKANAGFAELQKMRNNSPTGGALGQVSEREIAYLQSTIGNLEQSQTADQLKDNLRRVKNAYMDIIHGEGKGPPREKLTFQEKSKVRKFNPATGKIE